MIVFPTSFIKSSGPTPLPLATIYFNIGDSGSYPGSGTTITDLSPYGNNGTLSGDWSYSSSNGGTIVMGATNSLVTVTQNSRINFSNISSPISIVIWAKISSSYTDNDGIWNKEFGAGGGYDGIRLLAYTTNSLYLGVNGGAYDSKGPSSSNAFTSNTWAMITTIIKGGTSKIYINDSSSPVLSLSTPGQSLNGTANLEIGRDFNSGAGYIPMTWGQFWYYKGAELSLSNIAELFDTNKSRYGL